MVRHFTRYGVDIVVPLQFSDAVRAVKAALGAEGFGVLCEIDIAATMKGKLGVDFRPYVILGVCNPMLAHQALSMEPDIGLLLPCNVIVYGAKEAGQSVIAALDPVVALGVTGNPALAPLAEEVRTRLVRALRAVENGPIPPRGDGDKVASTDTRPHTSPPE